MSRPMIALTSRIVLGLALAGFTTASAADAPPARTGLELGVAGGYTQGWGAVGAGVPDVERLGGAGFALQLDLGWRIHPRWVLGVYGEGAIHAAGNDRDDNYAWSAAAGVQAQYHLRPGARLDPWVGVGSGWRGYWGKQQRGTHVLQGLDYLRVRIGVESRVSETFAIGPVVGVALTQFLSEKPAGQDAYRDTTNRKPSTFVFAGISGRFAL